MIDRSTSQNFDEIMKYFTKIHTYLEQKWNKKEKNKYDIKTTRWFNHKIESNYFSQNVQVQVNLFQHHFYENIRRNRWNKLTEPFVSMKLSFHLLHISHLLIIIKFQLIQTIISIRIKIYSDVSKFTL